MDVLSIHGLKKRFGEKEVLRGVNIAVPEGSIFGFIGKNGAGKTTAMKAVLGLLRPDSGEITVAGEKVRFGGSAANRYTGYLPDVPAFYSFMTASEYLAFCGKIAAMEDADIRIRSAQLLEQVGLAGEKHRIGGYSRGMKQRLGIAQALLSRPKLLICDEPTSALDPVGRKEILDLLRSVRQQTTVLFSTHILSDMERICTDAAFLDGGVIRMQGKLTELKERGRPQEYILETERISETEALLEVFRCARRAGGTQIQISGEEDVLRDVLRFVTDQRISLVKMERMEPTLESLFLEVTDR